MNILPVILLLMLILSVITVEKLQKFRNQTIVQTEYQKYMKESDRQIFNKRQRLLFGLTDKSHRQLTLRYSVDKKLRDDNLNIAKQARLLTLELMKILYSHAEFYKELEAKRPNFLEEMLDEIEKAAEEAPKGFIKRYQDIARLQLADPELQLAFYHMLKGTASRDQMRELNSSQQPIDPHIKEKAYVSLFTFVNFDKKLQIKVQLAPRELLKAIFVTDEVVDEIIKKRNEPNPEGKAGDEAFKNEFVGKRRPGLEDTILEFKLTNTDKTEHN